LFELIPLKLEILKLLLLPFALFPLFNELLDPIELALLLALKFPAADASFESPISADGRARESNSNNGVLKESDPNFSSLFPPIPFNGFLFGSEGKS